MNANEVKIPFSTERYEKRLIVFIDLIGFKNYVLSNYGEGKENAVKTLTAYFQDKVSEGAKYIKGKSHSYKPSFIFFSDTIIISFPLELFNAADELKALTLPKLDIDKFNLLAAASTSIYDIQLHVLQHDMLTRGCMTIGDVYHNQNTWFGPGIIEAYEHESKLAIYPRVILSKQAFKYFEKEISAANSSNWIQDLDGFYFANYIARIHVKLSDDFCEAHHKLREIIVKNSELMRSSGKHKELQKWEWLAVYFNNYTNTSLKKVHGSKLSQNIKI